MTLINISNKIINLGSDPILPDETRTITKDIARLPAIQAFADMRLVQIIDDGKAEAPAAEPATPAASAANEPVGSGSEKDNPVADDKKASQSKKK